ncbi:unnamed protein product [Cylindrotheca closterium]|uniref:Sulfhydryl oxidase n=1 Tax=Cylindrotheca closterium TaxID=2856 RepID=A0AAD2FIJ8_9STRA|nr:unnamed protein product [Cylindrotheca closterium]
MMQAIIFLSFYVLLVAGTATDTYLYLADATEHPIKEYIGEENRFMDSNSPRVVEFYSPSCPACVQFKPKYIKLAKEVTEKYPQIEFFAVSCDDHFDTCNEFGIDDFPTLKLYKAGEDSGTEMADDEGGYTVDQIVELLDVSNGESIGIDRENEPEGGAENVDEENDENEADSDANEEGSGGERSEDNSYIHNADGDDHDENAPEADDGEADDQEDPRPQFRKENENIQEDESDKNDIKDGTSDENGEGDENLVEHFRRENEDHQETETYREHDMDGDNDEDTTGENDETDEDNNGSSNDEGTSINAEITKARRGGALHAKYKPMELDRFRSPLLKKLQDYDRKQKRKGFFGIFFGGTKDNAAAHNVESDVLTKTMRANTPGTEEFIARRKSLDEIIQKARKRWRNRGSISNSMTIGMLPYHKDVRGRRRPLVRSYAHLSEEEGLILDVTHSFVMGLKYGLFVKSNQLDSNQLNTFRDYLDLLGVSLPPEWRLHKLILELRQNYVKVGKGRSNLLEILDKYQIQEGWSKDCTKGKFTCGFWKLLHTSTVGIAENRGGLNLIESGLILQSARTFSPLEAANAIRNYIDHFFTCGPCRKEFIATYDSCENNRRCDRLTEELEGASVADWKELPTWLWEVHNEVSVRVVKTRANSMNAGLPTKDKHELSATEQLEVLWPQIKDCIACFKEDGSWKEAGIFTFLESKYWHGTEIDPKYDRLLKFEREPSSSSVPVVFLLGLLVMYFVLKSVKGRSNVIQVSVIKAKQLASSKTWQGKKSRFKD